MRRNLNRLHLIFDATFQDNKTKALYICDYKIVKFAPPLTFTRFCNKCAITPLTLLSTENKCKGLLLYSIVLTTLDNILLILFVPYCEFGFLRNLFDKNKYLHIIPVESVVLAVCSQSKV